MPFFVLSISLKSFLSGRKISIRVLQTCRTIYAGTKNKPAPRPAYLTTLKPAGLFLDLYCMFFALCIYSLQ